MFARWLILLALTFSGCASTPYQRCYWWGNCDEYVSSLTPEQRQKLKNQLLVQKQVNSALLGAGNGVLQASQNASQQILDRERQRQIDEQREQELNYQRRQAEAIEKQTKILKEQNERYKYNF